MSHCCQENTNTGRVHCAPNFHLCRFPAIASSTQALALIYDPSHGESRVLSAPMARSTDSLCAAAQAGQGHFCTFTICSFRTCIVWADSATVLLKVVDMGCGTGALLSVLVSPAEFLDDSFPSEILSHSPALGSPYVSHELERIQSVQPQHAKDAELHVKRVVGIDICAQSLKSAILTSTPPLLSQVERSNITSQKRWEELDVEIWQGDSSVWNDAFADVDAIIASEVSLALATTRKADADTHIS